MNAHDLEFLADLLKRRSGLSLTPDKYRLVEPRLARVAPRFGFRSAADLFSELRHEPEALTSAVTESMTINETSFFRDPVVFEHFAKVMLPAVMRARAAERKIRIWCAGAATGQEPYSLAMLLAKKQEKLRGWETGILATDLSALAIARAEKGVYSQFEIQRGLSAEFLLSHFTQDGERWVISEELRDSVCFRTANLLDPFDWVGEVDIIFCRHVLLYFDDATKADMLARFARVLSPQGWLVLGRSESVDHLSSAIVPLKDARLRGCYAKSRAPAALAS